VKRLRPVVAVQVDLYGGSAAAVTLEPSARRWPQSEALDRLSLPVCFAALTLRQTSRSLTPRVRHLIMQFAATMTEAPPPDDLGQSWAEAVAGRRLVPRARPGEPSVVGRLLEARDGLVAGVKGPSPSALAMASSTAALAGFALRETTTDVQLSAALALEGVLLWFGQAESRTASLQRATCAAFTYALRRLEDADRPTPDVLLRVLSGYRDVRT
jgi:hypothetical protein